MVWGDIVAQNRKTVLTDERRLDQRKESSMNKLIITGLLALGFATWSFAELIENGDFADGVAYWQMGPSGHYGNPDPKFQVVEGALEVTKLHSAHSSYLTISQAVNIRKGKRYKLSYEVKGVGKGEYGVSIVHPSKGRHHTMKKKLPGPSWTLVEAEFEGSYDTDEKWFKKVRSGTRKNELHKGVRTTRDKKLGDIKKLKRADPASRSTLLFGVGSLDSSIAIRNVSIVELK